MNIGKDRFPIGESKGIFVLSLAMMVAVIIVISAFAMPPDSAPVTVVTTDIETPDYYVINNTTWDDIDLIDFGPIVIPVYISLPMMEVRAPAHEYYMIVLVNGSILHAPGVSERVDRYADAIERTGLGCWVWEYTSGGPDFIKSFLIDHSSKLVGAFFVGDIPPCYYEMWTDWKDDGNIEYELFPCDLFYTDLDGAWWDGNGNSIYDNHSAGSGNIFPDIFLGRLDTDNMTGDEATLVNNYFDKNHEFRTGNITFAPQALGYIDDDWQGTTGDLLGALLEAYPTPHIVNDKAGTNKVDYLSLMNSIDYAIVHLKCHGYPQGHGFKIPVNGGSDYEADGLTGYDDYRPNDFHVMMFNFFVCSGCRFTEADCLGNWAILSDTYTLAAVGSTKTGSMRYESAFYERIGDGFRLGGSFQTWHLAWAEISRPWFYGMTVLGDPTLRFGAHHYVTIDTPGVDNAEDVVHYRQNGAWKWGDVVDGQFREPVDYASMVTIQNVIDGSHYTTPDQNQFWIVEPQFLEVQYYEQHEVEIETSGLPWSSPATVYYTANGSAMSGLVGDGHPFIRWVDNDTVIGVDEIVMVNGDERYHTAGETSWYVGGDLHRTVEYHPEILITIESNGLGPPLHTFVTIGTANPGMDIDDFVVTLSEMNGYSWQGWVHLGTTLTALDCVEASDSEKYIAVLWTEGGGKHPPPTVIADEAGLVYTIHYAGLKKEMFPSPAGLTDTITVYINASMPLDPGPGNITIQDSLPNELSYVLKSARMDSSPLRVNITEMEACGIKHQMLSFETSAIDHNISYEVKVNRAYANDTTIHNRISAIIDLDEFDPVTVNIMGDLVIEVYNGPTVSSSYKGPKYLFLRDWACWEFTFIVKNNYDYAMMNTLLRDRFDAALCNVPPVFCFHVDVLVNLNTEYQFNCIPGYTDLIMRWSLGEVAEGEAFMIQFKLSAEIPIYIQTSFSFYSFQAWSLDTGAVLTWDDPDGFRCWKWTRPMTVYLIPLWFW
jgi:hypothetical protein